MKSIPPNKLTLVSFFVLLLLLEFVVKAQRTSTVTVTESKTLTSIVILSSDFVCVKLANVTGACRQGRRFQTDDDVGEMFDHMLDSQFVPTKTLGLEVTSLVSDVLPHNKTAVIESSLLVPKNNVSTSSGYFSKLSNFFNSIVSRISVTITHVLTLTLFRTTGTTTSFFIKGCTPSPLLYVTCPVDQLETSTIKTAIEDPEERFFHHGHDVYHHHHPPYYLPPPPIYPPQPPPIYYPPPPVHTQVHQTLVHQTHHQTHQLENHHQTHHHLHQHQNSVHVTVKKKRPNVAYITKIEKSTVTAVVTSTTVGLCGKLVNVTGPCRLRRGFWVEDPIVLTFDEDRDYSIDDMVSIDAALSPTSILSIETTAAPDMIAEARGYMSKDDSRHFLSGSVISPSSAISSLDEFIYEHDEKKTDLWNGLKKVVSLKASLLKNRFRPRNTIAVVTTCISVVTHTTTTFVTVSTKTFFIQLCTPSPFPFDVCGSRKRRSSTLGLPVG